MKFFNSTVTDDDESTLSDDTMLVALMQIDNDIDKYLITIIEYSIWSCNIHEMIFDATLSVMKT